MGFWGLGALQCRPLLEVVLLLSFGYCTVLMQGAVAGVHRSLVACVAAQVDIGGAVHVVLQWLCALLCISL